MKSVGNAARAMVLEVEQQFGLATISGLDATASDDDKRAEIDRVLQVFAATYEVQGEMVKVSIPL